MSAPQLQSLPFAPSISRSALASYDLGAFWDEVFAAPGEPRPHYEALSRRLATLSPDEVEARRRAADLAILPTAARRALVLQHDSDVSDLATVPEDWELLTSTSEPTSEA